MSFLDFLEPLFKIIPEVKAPEVKPSLKNKLLWTALVLALFFVMGHVLVLGIDTAASFGGRLEQIQLILASKIGSLVTLGIGPIVLASIILQLMVGGKLLNLDLTNPKDKGRFTSLQKIFAIALCFFEAGAYTGFGIFPSLITAKAGFMPLVVLQIALGGIIVIYLDEIVSRYGIGSGVGLFIAAGVAGGFFWQVFMPPLAANPAGGRLLLLLSSAVVGDIITVLIVAIPIIFAILIFFLVTFAEGIHVNIPIAIATKGTGGRFPVKFLYVSNMPVILAAALFANIQIWAAIAGKSGLLGQLVNGIAWATQVPIVEGYGLIEGLIILGISQTVLLEFLHAIVYIVLLVVLCVIFGKFWVELGGQSTEAVSNQLQKSGMYIPGFRRDPRIIKQILNRYIPPITVLGSIFVGLLAGISDIITGSLVSGIGILLTVGIVYRMYEELAREQAVEQFPILGRFLGR